MKKIWIEKETHELLEELSETESRSPSSLADEILCQSLKDIMEELESQEDDGDDDEESNENGCETEEDDDDEDYED